MLCCPIISYVRGATIQLVSAYTRRTSGHVPPPPPPLNSRVGHTECINGLHFRMVRKQTTKVRECILHTFYFRTTRTAGPFKVFGRHQSGRQSSLETETIAEPVSDAHTPCNVIPHRPRTFTMFCIRPKDSCTNCTLQNVRYLYRFCVVVVACAGWLAVDLDPVGRSARVSRLSYCRLSLDSATCEYNGRYVYVPCMYFSSISKTHTFDGRQATDDNISPGHVVRRRHSQCTAYILYENRRAGVKFKHPIKFRPLIIATLCDVTIHKSVHHHRSISRNPHHNAIVSAKRLHICQHTITTTTDDIKRCAFAPSRSPTHKRTSCSRGGFGAHHIQHITHRI